MGRKVIIFLIFFALPLSAWAGEVMVQSCHDGDTCAIQVAGLALKVRLAGIDAPEMGRKKGSEQPFARESRDALNAMVAGKKVEVGQYGIDAYNRPLVTLKTPSGTIVNEELVKLGLAEIYEGNKAFDLTKLKLLQSQAQNGRRGVWSLGARYVSPYLYRKKSKVSEEG
ncbi:MAG TPA: thermonuclease family protein [bacterium]|nr:thermonuclease family protein [bacterium]